MYSISRCGAYSSPCLTQATGDDGRLVWSPVNHIPHRDGTAIAQLILLTTTNGTALTLTGSHIVYVADAASGMRRPVPARDIEVCMHVTPTLAKHALT